jgi:hypothetical protein
LLAPFLVLRLLLLPTLLLLLLCRPPAAAVVLAAARGGADAELLRAALDISAISLARSAAIASLSSSSASMSSAPSAPSSAPLLVLLLEACLPAASLLPLLFATADRCVAPLARRAGTATACRSEGGLTIASVAHRPRASCARFNGAIMLCC